ncbi:MAG: helix-turn-helix transcriptional regulator [Faecalibacterium sp.]|jgi:transcriptional regulator with XRE-family HTH domain
MMATTRCKGGRKQVREYLIEAREKAGLTQQDVANRIGISRQYYQMVETGERQKRMDLSLAGGLSAILNIPITEIVQKESAVPDAEGAEAE